MPRIGQSTVSVNTCIIALPRGCLLAVAFFVARTTKATGCHRFVNLLCGTIAPGRALDDPDATGGGTGWPPRHPDNALAAVVSPPADDTLPAFPRARRSKGKTRFSGGIRRRWKDDADGAILEWDYQHGRVEKYDSRGNHLGEFDPVTGDQIGPAKPGRTVEP